MADIIDILYYITLLVLPIAPYYLFFKIKQINKRDFLYLFKYFIAKSAVKKYQIKCSQSKLLENPKKILTKVYTENHFIYGVDQNGNDLSIRFTLRTNLVAEVFVRLRLADNTVYSISIDQPTKFYSLTSWLWKTNDLHIEILEPFKRLRITFNGLLYNNLKNETEHIQFHFIWAAAASPLFYPQEANTSLLADQLARQQWRDGDWLSLIGDERGYEQFGALRGFVKGEAFEDDLVLNLPSCRTRLWCQDERESLVRSLRLFIATQNGDLFSLWCKSLKEGCTDLQYGSIYTSDGKSTVIQQTDLRLDYLGENRNIPKIFIAHILDTYRVHRIVFHLKSSNSILNIPADCDYNNQQGKALIDFWYNTNTSSDLLLPPPLLIERKPKYIPDDLICWFHEENAKIVELTGGKGCSLSLLNSIESDQFLVPKGFIITTKAYTNQLENNFNLMKAVSILDDICCGRTKGNVEKACEETVKTFENEGMLRHLNEEIMRNVEKYPETKWAIRSSAIGEDSEELSAAGQNSTFLGYTKDNLIDAVIKCWASLYTYQSVKYRHQHGLEIISKMAVIIQEMIPSDNAGVLFTCHPSTSNPLQMVITSNHGIGESVVSGKSEPDTVIINRFSLQIINKISGSKQTMTKMFDDGIREIHGIDSFSINDEQARQLAKVGVMLEEKFGSPRDIEWSFYQNTLYLLQSRPITTINNWSNFELSHEFDVPTLTNDLVLTIANTGEVLPGAISALTYSSLIRVLDRSLQFNINQKKVDYNALRSLSIYQHHLFMDVNNSIHRLVEDKISLQMQILDLAIFGHPIVNEEIHEISKKRFGIVKPTQKLMEFVTMIKLACQNEKFAKRSRSLSQTKIDIDAIKDNLKEIYRKIDKSLEIFGELSRLHCYTTRTSVSYQYLAMVVLAEKATTFNINHYNDVAQLLASCDDVISAEIPNILGKISQILIDSKQASDFLLNDPQDGREFLRKNSPKASEMFENFLKEHGHRAMREFDLYSKPWYKKPSDVIKIIQMNCKTAFSRQTKLVQPINDVIKNLTTPTQNSTRRLLKFIVGKSRKAVGFRELTKSETIRFVDKIRVAYGILGDRMAFNGLIPDPELIYHLTHYEIGEILNERSPVLIIKAFKRRKLFPIWDEIKFPEISYGIPFYEKREFIPRTGLEKIVCKGTPVCNGVVQARACVITDLSQIDELQEGDVLITYCTDIGWSPYFPLIGGIVTELGGLVSHGAVIAREYGLPCIVGAKDATKLFKTGDTVVLSGKTGTIFLV